MNEDEDRPLTVGRVLADLGVVCSPRQAHRLCRSVHDAYIRAHGCSPTPRLYYDEDGTPVRFGCFTEADRDFILCALAAVEEGPSPVLLINRPR